MTQCEVFPIKAEQAPGGTSLSPFIVCLSQLSCSDLLIVVVKQPSQTGEIVSGHLKQHSKDKLQLYPH